MTWIFVVIISLQDELSHIQGESKRLRSQQDKLQLQLAERSRELLDNKKETEELRLQVNKRIYIRFSAQVLELPQRYLIEDSFSNLLWIREEKKLLLCVQ